MSIISCVAETSQARASRRVVGVLALWLAVGSIVQLALATGAIAQSPPQKPNSPEIASIDRDLAEVLGELERLGEEEQIATEAYLRAQDELEKASIAEASTRAVVDEMRGRLVNARAVLAMRVAAAYKRGSDWGYRLSLLLQVRSLGEVGIASKVVSVVVGQDQRTVAAWKEAEADQAEAEAALSRVTEEKAAFAKEASIRLQEIQRAIETKQNYRASLESHKRALLEAYEQEQRQREQQAAAAVTSSDKGRFRVAGAASDRVARAVEIALGQLGKPYRFGASGPDAFDCSGLVMYAFEQAGLSGIPHRADLQYFLSDRHPSRAELMPGDLVFFSKPGTPEGVHHDGIYVGDGMMVHAPQTGDVVKVSSIDRSDYFGATRLA